MDIPVASPSQFPPFRLWIAYTLDWVSAHTGRILALIVVLAIALDLRRIWLGPISLQAGQTADWWTIAVNLIKGQGYASCFTRYFPFCGPANQLTASREPVPVLLFAAVAFLTNQSLLAAVGVEALVNVAILILIFLLTRRMLNKPVALLGALAWAIYRPALDLVPQLSGDLIATLFVTLGLYFVMRARESERLLDWILGGAALGLSALSRSAALAIVAVIVAGLLIERLFSVQSVAKKLRLSLIMTAVVLLVMTPWVVRNDLVFGQPAIASTLTGYNLYRHNYMLGSNNYFRYVGGSEGDQAIASLVASHPELPGTENEAQMDAFYRSGALKVITAHPVQYVLLSAYRFLPLWFNWQVLESDGGQPNVKDNLVLLEQGALLALALFGLGENGRGFWPIWASILIFALSYMAVDSQLRYLIPVMPLVIILSAAGVTKLVRSFSSV